MKYLTGLVLVFTIACAHLTTQDKLDLSEYEAAQDACIVAHRVEGKAAIEACRAQVKKSWCAQEAAKMDAGVCQ